MASLTRKAIMDSCVRLLEQHPVNKITVKDIVEDCGINRNTFYYHFQDLPDLINAIAREDADRMIQEYETVGSVRECMDIAIGYSLQHKRITMHIFHSADRDILERSLMNLCAHVCTKYIDSLLNGRRIAADDRDIIIRSFQYECFGLVIDWMNGGMKPDMTQKFLRLCELREGSAEAMIERSLQDATLF
ncbi:MAG: TetR/AcrR family transcriptional regulator [Clostridia bacterium]|nr:TetR/AcrR family transcriptional regulator [Clostridia bacterium]